MIADLTLHSTMFLLIQRSKLEMWYSHLTLHSTMFLLIPGDLKIFALVFIFTFHNVSINTDVLNRSCNNLSSSLHSTMFLLILICSWLCFQVYSSLHSTMFLLILVKNYGFAGRVFVFTFHNVSINTEDLAGSGWKDSTLHSTMFLLIR